MADDSHMSRKTHSKVSHYKDFSNKKPHVFLILTHTHTHVTAAERWSKKTDIT